MKQAYVSLVTTGTRAPDSACVARIDALLAERTRMHEIVLVIPWAAETEDYSRLRATGPVSVVTTHMRATVDGGAVAGLARAVGDFVIDWRGELDQLDGEAIASLLEPTDGGSDLVEATGVETSQLSRAFYAFVNSLRPRDAPVRRVVARCYSRRALAQVLAATAFEQQLDILAAELPVSRMAISLPAPTPHQQEWHKRLGDGLSLLSKGTRFGSAIPLTLAVLSALFGVAAALYAVGFLVFSGRTPEGWTTLMVVIGLGQAAVLAMLGLTWTRIDAIGRGLSRNHDATAEVLVVAPRPLPRPSST
jgi:hypothetical protein